MYQAVMSSLRINNAAFALAVSQYYDFTVLHAYMQLFLIACFTSLSSSVKYQLITLQLYSVY
jgi:hypothetical protein